MAVSHDECARHLLQVVPLVMCAIRTEMRSHRGSDLSVPQFRVLIYLSRHEGASLSNVAEHLGLTLPSTSRMIDGLVSRELAIRRIAPGDRRRMTLTLTERGQKAMQSAYSNTLARLSERLEILSPSECAAIVDAMIAIESIFAPEEKRKAENADPVDLKEIARESRS